MCQSVLSMICLPWARLMLSHSYLRAYFLSFAKINSKQSESWALYLRASRVSDPEVKSDHSMQKCLVFLASYKYYCCDQDTESVTFHSFRTRLIIANFWNHPTKVTQTFRSHLHLYTHHFYRKPTERDNKILLSGFKSVAKLCLRLMFIAGSGCESDDQMTMIAPSPGLPSPQVNTPLPIHSFRWFRHGRELGRVRAGSP